MRPRGAKRCTRSQGAGVCLLLLHSLWTFGLTISDYILLLFWSHLGFLSFLAMAIDPRTCTHKVMLAGRCPSAPHHILLASHLSGWLHTSSVSSYTDSVLLWAEARHLSALLLSQDLVRHLGYLLSPCVSTAKSTMELGWPFHPLLVLCFCTSVSHVWASQYTPWNITLKRICFVLHFFPYPPDKVPLIFHNPLHFFTPLAKLSPSLTPFFHLC